jgi:hypothetical protein
VAASNDRSPPFATFCRRALINACFGHLPSMPASAPKEIGLARCGVLDRERRDWISSRLTDRQVALFPRRRARMLALPPSEGRTEATSDAVWNDYVESTAMDFRGLWPANT